MDATLTRLKELILQREAIDKELNELIAGAPAKEKRVMTCKNCGQEGHNKKTCTNPPKPPTEE